MGSLKHLILLLAALTPLSTPVSALSIRSNQSAVVVPRQDQETEIAPLLPPEERFGLCGSNPQRWGLNEVPRRLEEGLVVSDSEVRGGLQDALLSKVPGLRGYTCGSANTCNLFQLEENCAEFPVEVSLLRSLANFANLFQAYRDTIEAAGAFVVGQAGNMVGIFNPQEEKGGNEDAHKGVTLGLAVLKAALSLGSAPAFATAGSALDLILAFLPLLEEEAEEPENGFDQFATISGTVSALTRRTRRALNTAIDQTLGITDFTNEGALRMLRAGDFLDPVASVDLAVEDDVIASLAAPGINLLWTQQQAIVLKLTRSTLGLDIDPCGPGMFPGNQKFCAGDNMFVIRRYPKQGEFILPADLNKLETFDLPGMSNLDEFGGLTLGEIAEAAVNNQRAHGLFGAPKGSDIVDGVNSLNFEGGSRVESLFFNIPVCRLNSFEFDEIELNPCQRDSSDEATCRMHVLMICGCQFVRIRGQDWPYAPNQENCIGSRERDDVTFDDR